MRTTLDIEDDVLAAAKELANQQRLSTGQVISRMLREAMSGVRPTSLSSKKGTRSIAGFQPFPSEGVLITNGQIDALRDTEGV